MTKSKNGLKFQGDMFSTNTYFLEEEIKKCILKNKLSAHEKEILEEIKEISLGYVRSKVKIEKNKSRLDAIDAQKEKIPLKGHIDKNDMAKLPDWIKERIDDAVIVGKSGRVVSVGGKKYHLDNPLNDLDGGVWTYFLRSVINTRYPVSGPEGFAHHIRKIHPTPKPPQLMRDIVKFFTKKNEWVLDYFMGVGGTLLGASLCDRNAIGIDLNKKYIEAYKKASKELGLKEQACLCGDSLEVLSSSKILETTGNEKISLICIDPPYGDMMSRKKTGEAAKKKLSTESTPFTDHSQDLGNVDKETFLSLLKKSVEISINCLKEKRYVIVFTKDFQPSGRDLNLLHYDIIKELSDISGLNYVGMKIWADESINLYPYGYPYAFVPNQLHQYILVFRKDSQAVRKAAKAS